MNEPKTNRIGGPLRSRLNALAHTRALRHETRLRTDLAARVQHAANNGATLADLHRYVDELEREPA